VRVAYLGTSAFAATVLRRLAEAGQAPALVVTPPDRPRGRGRHVESPPAAAVARELGLAVHQTESVNARDSVEAIRRAADRAVVCAFGQLIREPLLSELLMLNVHPSLIPRWRGAAPIERAIMSGDAETGVTIMRVTAGLDSGPVALAERETIADTDDYGSLSARLAGIAGDLATRALALEPGDLNWAEQDDAAATYAEKVRPEERRLDPGRPAVELERRVRALRPHIGTHLELTGGERLGVTAASTLAEGPPLGEVAVAEQSIVVGCADGALRLDEVRPAGGRPMPADAYLRGHAVPELAR
jgi:methionyl-tRNA formyltransferase